MIDLRVLLGAVALFAGAYVGVSLLPKSTPASKATRPAPSVAEQGLKAGQPQPGVPDAAEAEAVPPAVPAPAAAKVAAPPPAAAAPPVLSEHELMLGRDRLRVSALQAATAYALAPCDITNKAAFVVAVSTYLRTLRSGPQETDAPADDRVHQALRAAFNAGGVAERDFPADAWPLPADLAQAVADRPASCADARRAERRSR